MIQKLILLVACFLVTAVNANPHANWSLDELGSASYPYTLGNSQSNEDATAYTTPSTGNTSGKICSALDFTANSTSDFATLDANTLDGATDFTISFWHKGSSSNGRSLLSGARSAQKNE